MQGSRTSRTLTRLVKQLLRLPKGEGEYSWRHLPGNVRVSLTKVWMIVEFRGYCFKVDLCKIKFQRSTKEVNNI